MLQVIKSEHVRAGEPRWFTHPACADDDLQHVTQNRWAMHDRPLEAAVAGSFPLAIVDRPADVADVEVVASGLADACAFCGSDGSVPRQVFFSGAVRRLLICRACVRAAASLLDELDGSTEGKRADPPPVDDTEARGRLLELRPWPAAEASPLNCATSSAPTRTSAPPPVDTTRCAPSSPPGR